MKTEKPLKVLLLDDDPDMMQSFHLHFDGVWKVEALTSPFQLKKKEVDVRSFDVIVLDLVFKMDSFGNLSENSEEMLISESRRFITWMQYLHPHIPLVIHSGLLPDLTKDVYKITEEFDHLLAIPKPCFYDDFQERVESYVIRHRRNRDENKLASA